MASQYGYTPDQILDLTPRQFQLLSARAGVRVHNALQERVALAGGKPEYIDRDTEKMLHHISKENKKTDINKDVERDIVEKRLQEKQQKLKG